MSEKKTLWVKSLLEPNKNNGHDKLALFEKDKRHPGGEAFVAGTIPVEVFPTPKVIAELRANHIEEVAVKDLPAESKASETTAPKGKQTTPPKKEETETSDKPELQLEGETALPDEFPERDALVATGFDTAEKIFNAGQKTILDIDGIGKVKLEAIGKALEPIIGDRVKELAKSELEDKTK